MNLVPEIPDDSLGLTELTDSDKVLTIAIIGLGPVGVCAAVSLLDMLATRKLSYRIVGIDPIDSRRSKMQAIYDKIPLDEKGAGEFVVKSIDEAKETVKNWTNGGGCSAVMEVGFLIPTSDISCN
jgi:threonine dehydrogenase-like Zn-dependent dehydrogenase